MTNIVDLFRSTDKYEVRKLGVAYLRKDSFMWLSWEPVPQLSFHLCSNFQAPQYLL